jgi:hypothetical protein
MWECVGIWCSPNTLKSPQILFSKNTLPWWRVFNLAKNTLELRRFEGIFRDYFLKTQISKQPIEEIPEYKIIPSHPLKYPKSKQGLIRTKSAWFLYPQTITGRPRRIHPCATISFSESEMGKTCEPPQKTDNASISKLDSWNWKGREKDLPRLPRGWIYALRTSY